jgi:hypothetical protein
LDKAAYFYLHLVILVALNFIVYGSWVPSLVSHDSYEGVVTGFALAVLMPVFDAKGIQILKQQWKSIGAKNEESN